MTVIVNIPVAVYILDNPFPQTRNFGMCNGDSRKLTVTVYDSSRTVVNLTGCTISFAIGTSPTSAAFVTYSIGSGITVSSPTTGIFTVTISAANTGTEVTYPALAPWAYQCTITDGSSNVTTLLRGAISMMRAVA